MSLLTGSFTVILATINVTEAALKVESFIPNYIFVLGVKLYRSVQQWKERELGYLKVIQIKRLRPLEGRLMRRTFWKTYRSVLGQKITGEV